MRNLGVTAGVLAVAALAAALVPGLAGAAGGGGPARVPAGATGPAALDAPPSSTRVEFFEPYEGVRVAGAVRVAGHASGSCFAGSIAVDDPNAWRCLAGDRVLDPCFAPPGEPTPGSLACGTPWTGVTVLELAQPLPRALADRAAAPTAGWLLQLANGARCQLAQGASGRTDGVEVAYVCSRGDAAGALDWSEEPWTVPFLEAGRRAPVRVEVTVAWGG